jgi:hypothetical protein
MVVKGILSIIPTVGPARYIFYWSEELFDWYQTADLELPIRPLDDSNPLGLLAMALGPSIRQKGSYSGSERQLESSPGPEGSPKSSPGPVGGPQSSPGLAGSPPSSPVRGVVQRAIPI